MSERDGCSLNYESGGNSDEERPFSRRRVNDVAETRDRNEEDSRGNDVYLDNSEGRINPITYGQATFDAASGHESMFVARSNVPKNPSWRRREDMPPLPSNFYTTHAPFCLETRIGGGTSESFDSESSRIDFIFDNARDGVVTTMTQMPNGRTIGHGKAWHGVTKIEWAKRILNALL